MVTREIESVLQGCITGRPHGARAARLAQLYTAVTSAPLVWSIDFLLRELPDTADGVWLFADWCGSDAARGNTLAAAVLFDTAPHGKLSVTGGQIISTPGSKTTFDIVTGAVLYDEFPVDWFETRVFNLLTLFRACNARSLEWQRTRSSLPPGSTPTPPPPS